MRPFHPADDATTTISGSVSTARGEIKKRPSGAFQLRIFNGGTTLAFIRVGDVAVEAAATDLPLAGGASLIITVLNSDSDPDTHVAAILASSTGSIYVSTGRGIA